MPASRFVKLFVVELVAPPSILNVSGAVPPNAYIVMAPRKVIHPVLFTSLSPLIDNGGDKLMVIDSEYIHILESIISTIYVVVIVGLTVMQAVVDPSSHK